VLQGGERLNPDQEGNPLATVVRVYQLKGDETLQAMDHRTVWEKGKEAFGEEFVAEEERTIYPHNGELIEIEPDPATTHVVAVALFREPTGTSWFRVWEMPRFHGDRVCLDERQGRKTDDPCFLVLLDENRVDGGHTAPPGFDMKAAGIGCPPPPLKVKPPAPEKKKQKKQKKPDGEKLKKAKEASETEPPAAPEGPSAPEAPQAPEAPGGGG
jgi:type VI secretion system VasD/TssJ family lipoprotein